MRGDLERYPDVSFIDGLMFGDLLDDMIADYEDKYKELTGKEASLAQASTERLILNSCAVMIYQGMQYIDREGKNGLLKYSKGAFLDNLAALKRVERKPAVAAKTTLRFILSEAQSFDITIPAGTRARVDEVFFATQADAVILSGETQIETDVVCLTWGAAGNGYAPGTITTIVDPINYVASVANLTETSGGIDEEDDDSLAERVYLAPSGYSTAGPADAYRYWVQSYSQAIEDSLVRSESPGEVDIYVMGADGTLPGEETLRELKDYLSADTRRPLTDKVEVKAPAVNEYDIDVTYYIADTQRENADTIKKQVEAACEAFERWQKARIGRDVNPSRLMYLLVDAGACYAVIRSPDWQEITEPMISIPRSVKLEYGGLKDARLI